MPSRSSKTRTEIGLSRLNFMTTGTSRCRRSSRSTRANSCTTFLKHSTRLLPLCNHRLDKV